MSDPDVQPRLELHADGRPIGERLTLSLALLAALSAVALSAVSLAQNEAHWVLIAVTALIFAAVLAVTVLVVLDLPPLRDRTGLRLTRDGWSLLSWDVPTPMPYPASPVVRVDHPDIFARSVVWIDSRVASRVAKQRPNVWRRLSPRLHRDVEVARTIIPDARLPAALERVGAPSHCPACDYILIAPADRNTAAANVMSRCPECGWSLGTDEALIYGRHGPTVAGQRLRAGRQSLAGRGRKYATGLIFLTLAIGVVASLAFGRSSLISCESVTLALLGIGLAYLVVTAGGEIRGNNEAKADVDRPHSSPAGLVYLLACRDGIAQADIGDVEVRPEPWAKFRDVRIQRWPGGVRVRADRRFSLRLPWRNRPVDFIADLHDPRRDVKELRRRVNVLLHTG